MLQERNRTGWGLEFGTDKGSGNPDACEQPQGRDWSVLDLLDGGMHVEACITGVTLIEGI
jgi:hypothetical protein